MYLIPIDLAEEIKRVVGSRKRSSFLVEANAPEEAAGAWSSEFHPDLQTQDDINKWLRSLRQEDADRLA